MTDTSTEVEQVSIDELDFFWLDNGAPCFIGSVKDICKKAEALGFQIYYVMTSVKTTTKNTTGSGTTTVTRPGVVKVVNNLIGRAIIDAPDDLNLDVLEPNAWFALPKIPYFLVKKIDAFFRMIDTQYGTESIVLLTYDTNATGSEGWGILVPEQKNTSVNCDYNHESIVDEKPDNVYIVGSAHSHPGMSAYASGTDHNDQADFDGLHITYGWMKSKNGGATEFHIEMQMGGTAFILKPEQVFGDVPLPEPDDEIKEWVKKVQKKHTTSSTSTQRTGSGTGTYSGGSYSPLSNTEKVKVPDGCPDIKKNLVIAELLTPLEKECPFCSVKFIMQDLAKRRCLACHQYICLPGESVEDILKVREQAKTYTFDLDTSKNKARSVYIWKRSGTNNVYEKVYEGTGGGK